VFLAIAQPLLSHGTDQLPVHDQTSGGTRVEGIEAENHRHTLALMGIKRV
jgi:hypothetical protein